VVKHGNGDIYVGTWVQGAMHGKFLKFIQETRTVEMIEYWFGKQGDLHESFERFPIEQGIQFKLEMESYLTLLDYRAVVDLEDINFVEFLKSQKQILTN
jgi:hypothetical protein